MIRQRTAHDLTLLVVEDSHDMGTILAAALEDEGCTVHMARSGTAAVDLARRVRPDLITLDLALPGLGGADVIASLRADPTTRAIPILAISAHTGELEPSVRAEVVQVIAKPFYLSEVVGAVMETLGVD